MEQMNSNYCENCNVYVEDCLANCPLCGEPMGEPRRENGLYPDVTRVKYIDRRSFLGDVLVFITLLCIGSCIVLNLLFWQGVPWFIAVAAPVLYAWILVRHTIQSDAYIGLKVLLQMTGTIGMLLAFDFVSGWHGWSYEVLLPFVLLGGIVYIDFYSWVHKSYWRDNLLYAILFVILGFLPLIFYLNGITTAFLPMLLCTIGAALTVLGILRFTIRHLAEEIVKRLHM